MTRFHFLHGIFSFVDAQLLVAVLLLGFVANLGAAPLSEGVFADAARAQTALVLFGFTMLLLLLPKFLALGLALRQGRAPLFGGAAKMIRSAFAEMLLSALIAPVFLYFHAKFVFFSLLGKKVEWHAQQRGCETGSAWREAHEVFSLTTLVGILTAAITWWLTPTYLLWLLPIVLGWLLAIPLTAFLGNLRLGEGAEEKGFFLVPSELAPEEEVRALRQAERPRGQTVAGESVLDPAAYRSRSTLTNKEGSDLHRLVWTTPADRLPPGWQRALAHLEFSATLNGEHLTR